jgi:hydroxymethylglutaryl-CoA reductase
MVRAGGGFRAEMDAPLMISQVQLTNVKDAERATRAILAAKEEILAKADRAVPGLCARGGGARDLEVRTLGQPSDEMIVVHVIVDCRDAMGANLINTIAEAVADRLASLADGRVGLRILSNLCDKRCVRVRCRVSADMLATDDMDGQAVIDGIVNASRFAELDPYRAATHNKGIMNGVDAVVIATGNDWRAVEAGAHAYACRNGRYTSLTTWERAANGDLVGTIEMPMPVGLVGGATKTHPLARLALKIMDVHSAQDLGEIAVAVGLAQNMGALRALSTEGIQRGHMALHARNIAMSAGATGVDIDWVVGKMVAANDVRTDYAMTLLAGPRDA